MRILIHGEINTSGSTDGFILLRDLLVMFVVIICFAAVLVAMTVLPRQSSRQIERVEQEIAKRNSIMLNKVNQ